MGSFLCGQSEPYWIDAIERLKTIPLTATMDRLEISFDGLEKEYKEIFLDIACILKGWDKEDAIRVLESRGFHAEVGLRVLEQKSLITISESDEYEELGMHDHLEELGRNIVRRSHPDEPQRHSRLWIDKEIEYLLTNDLGTQATKCLFLRSPGFSAEIAIKGLAKMKDLRYICINLVKLEDSFKSNIVQVWEFDKVSDYLPSSLRFLKWIGFPFPSLPNTFQGKNLVEFEMYKSNFVQVWEDGEEKVLNNLRFLTIGSSKLRTFDLRLAPNLVQLTIDYCKDFEELHIPADHHSKLEYLHISDSKLTNLHLGNTPSLKNLTLQDCGDLGELQMPAECLNLKYLDLSHSKLKTINLRNTPNLEKLMLKGCSNLVELQIPAESLNLALLDLSFSKLINLQLGNTPNLKMLILEGCNDFVDLQMRAESLNLEYFYLSHAKLKTIHLGNTPNFEKLIVYGCNDLVELQMPAESLKLTLLDLSFSKLRNLHLGNTPNLKELKLRDCHDLANLHFRNTMNLEKLILKGCNDLVELQMPGESPKLEEVDLSHSKLKTINLGSTPNLETLILKGCNDLVELEMPYECLTLEKLYLGHSKLRTLDLWLTPNLKRLNLENCYDLVEINAPIGFLKELEFLDLSCCGRFNSFVFNNWSQPAEPGSLFMLHLIAEPIYVNALRCNNGSPKFQCSCYLEDDPASSFGNIRRLISINLCACTNLESFSRSICGLQCLTKLTLEGSIPEVPRDLKQLECLEEVTFSSAEIKYLPDSICKLKHLKSFKIKSWLLEKLPEDIGRLESLEKLILTDCKLLQDIPNSICKMKCINKLSLRGCIRVVELPEDIGCLEGLKELNINGTGITRLPHSIFQLRGLRIVWSMRLIDTYGLLLKRRRTSDADEIHYYRIDSDDEMFYFFCSDKRVCYI